MYGREVQLRSEMGRKKSWRGGAEKKVGGPSSAEATLDSFNDPASTELAPPGSLPETSDPPIRPVVQPWLVVPPSGGAWRAFVPPEGGTTNKQPAGPKPRALTTVVAGLPVPA